MATKLRTPDTDLIELSGKWVYQHPIVDRKLRVKELSIKLKQVNTTRPRVSTT